MKNIVHTLYALYSIEIILYVKVSTYTHYTKI